MCVCVCVCVCESLFVQLEHLIKPMHLILSDWQTKILVDTWANSVDPDESFFCFRLKPLFASVDMSKLKDVMHFRNPGMTGSIIGLNFKLLKFLNRGTRMIALVKHFLGSVAAIMNHFVKYLMLV